MKFLNKTLMLVLILIVSNSNGYYYLAKVNNDTQFQFGSTDQHLGQIEICNEKLQIQTSFHDNLILKKINVDGLYFDVEQLNKTTINDQTYVDYVLLEEFEQGFVGTFYFTKNVVVQIDILNNVELISNSIYSECSKTQKLLLYSYLPPLSF